MFVVCTALGGGGETVKERERGGHRERETDSQPERELKAVRRVWQNIKENRNMQNQKQNMAEWEKQNRNQQQNMEIETIKKILKKQQHTLHQHPSHDNPL